MPNTDYDFPPINLDSIDFDSIPVIVEVKIAKIGQDIETLKQMEKDLEHIQPDKEFHTPLLKNKMGWMLPSMTESMIVRMEEEKSLYVNAFDKGMIQGIIDSLENIDIMKSSRPLNERIVHARVELLRFRRSGLGEKDYERDIAAVKKKIADVSKYTEVNSCFQFPKLPHVIIKELVFYLCNTKKNQHLHFSIPVVPAETAKEISIIISEKQRLPRNQKEFDKKELHKVSIRSRHGII